MQECKETSVGILDSLLSNVEDQDLLSHEDAQMFYKRHYIEMCLGCGWDCYFCIFFALFFGLTIVKFF